MENQLNNKGKYSQNKKPVEWRVVLLSCIIAIGLTGLIVSGLDAKAQAYFWATQESLAEEVLRFHVLANSNSDEDQELKLLVKEQVIAYMERELNQDTDLLQTKVWVENHQEAILQLCQDTIGEAGYDYEVKVALTESYFPIKTYGDITFPEGEYEALKIEIGEAAGENWWCCLYPNLCFIDATISVVSEEGKEELQEVLSEEEYKLITTTVERRISWFFF